MAYNSIKMIVQLFENRNFTGQHVELSETTMDLSVLDFSRRAQSAIVHRGPSWRPEDRDMRATLIANRQISSELVTPPVNVTLGFDLYPDLATTLSAQGAAGTQIVGVEIGRMMMVTFPGAPEEILRVPVVVEVFDGSGFQGHKRILYGSVADLQGATGFGKKISSLRVLAGPDFQPGLGCKLFQQVNFSGAMLHFAPGDEVPQLRGFANDEISSAQLGVPVAAPADLGGPRRDA